MLLSASLFSGCSPAGNTNLAVPDDWIEIRAGAPFSLSAPPGTRFTKGTGKDSSTGSFTGPGFNLKYDYGRYSDPLTARSSDAEYREQTIEVQGKQARMITSHRPDISAAAPYFIGIHFPELQQPGISTVRLTLSAQVATQDEYTTIEQIFRSIRFIN